jgi:hypothetical protein
MTPYLFLYPTPTPVLPPSLPFSCFLFEGLVSGQWGKLLELEFWRAGSGFPDGSNSYWKRAMTIPVPNFTYFTISFIPGIVNDIFAINTAFYSVLI